MDTDLLEPPDIEQQEHQDPFLAMAKGIHDEINQKFLVRMDSMRKEMEASLSSVLIKAMNEVYGTRLKQLEEDLRHTKELNTQLLSFIKAMPTPQVVVPEHAIKVLVSEKPRKIERQIIYGSDGRADKMIETSSHSD